MNTELEWLHRGVPRPFLYRGNQIMLDGEWQLNGKPVRVPFPPESPASGWTGTADGRFHYERQFVFTPEPQRPRTFLHFGAVDQTAEVFLNGQHVGCHEGGYLPFSFEITALIREGTNLLAVDAVDTVDHLYPYGKQSRNPHGMWYTAVSGIWQSVWMEQVPERFVNRVRFRSDLTGIDLYVASDKDGEVQAETDGQCFTLMTNRWTRIEVAKPRLWSPDRPVLYPLQLTYGTDVVQSYFALRTVEIRASAAGLQQICLNGEPVYLHGLLDQGYFPEGIYTPGNAGQLEQDILNARALGFNTLRKHIKVEHEAFYTCCDLYGMLVLQDMVNSGGYTYLRDTVIPNLGFKRHLERDHAFNPRETFFVEHCKDIQQHLENHPCVVGYTIFNEGWGQFATSSVYRMLRKADTGRFYISASGWYQGYETDVDSEHVYFRNRVLKAGTRPLMLSECGGYPCDPGGERTQKAYGYGRDNGPEEFIKKIEELMDKMVIPSIQAGLSGCIYTQLTDVEGEINGLYSYDRSVCKVDAERMRGIAARCREAYAKANGI